MTYVLIFLLNVNGTTVVTFTKEPTTRERCIVAAEAMVEANVTKEARCVPAGRES